jgi:hypothetical protein
MIQPTALNFVTIACMVIIFTFLWNMGAAFLIKRNPESGIGKAMGVMS